MGSATIGAEIGEDRYPIGRFILHRARMLGLSRGDLVPGSVTVARRAPRGAHCCAADGGGGPSNGEPSR
jgi:hypothetical protein